jgi:CrcB protein
LLYERHFADALSVETRLIVGTGFLSSFTTYSTFAVETSGLAPALAAANVIANYALGLAGVVCGRWVARWAS